MALLASPEWLAWERYCRSLQHQKHFPRGPRQVILPESERRPVLPLRQDEQAALMGEVPGAEHGRVTVKRRR